MIKMNKKASHELKRKRLSRRLHAQAKENKAYNKAVIEVRQIEIRKKIMELRKKNEVKAKKN